MKELKEWFKNLQQREQQLVVIAAGAVGVLLFYSTLWSPFAGSVEKLRSSVVSAEKNLVWMKQAQNEVKQSSSRRGIRKPRSLNGRSLLGVIDKTRASSQIPDAKRIEEEGNNGVRVAIENVSFDKLILWFGLLQRQYGVAVTDLVVDKQNSKGIVNVRLIMQGPAT